MKKFTSTSLRFLGIVFLWMNLGHAPDLHAQARKPELDFETIHAAGNISPTGLWSNDITMWVADDTDRKLFAYVLATQERDAGKDLTITRITSVTSRVHSLWSDATTMWVLYHNYLSLNPGDIYARNLATGTRDAGKDFVLAAGNNHPKGLWSDGTTMWVGDDVDDKLYAYNLANKTADAGKDLTLAAGNDNSRGLWSNGITMWVADEEDDKLYAYNLANKTADAGKDFTLATGNDTPRGLWSDGTTMWVVNSASSGANDKVYAYVLPKESQTIENFTSSLSGTVDDTLDLSATASSGLEVTYVSSDPSIAEVGMGTEEGKLILKAGGDAMITASQVGNTEYFAVAVTQSITVSKKPQTIENFTSSLSGTVDDTLDLSATASSTLEVTYSSSDPSIAEVGMGTEEGKLILKAGGDAMITASQVGNPQYLAATEVSQSITVSKKDQTITFTLSAGILDDTLDLSATASSTLEVTYSSSDPSIAEVGMGMNAGKLILKALGNATITASQAGDAQYLEAPEVSQDITVNKKDQTITFTLSTGILGDTLDLSATASSTLEVTYSSSNTTIAEVGTGTEEGKLILKALGDAIITASQAGDAQYLAAPDVSHTITVSEKLQQTITFTLSGTGIVGDTLDLSATASSTLEISYSSSDTSIAEVGTGMNAGKLILKAAGDVIITASQVGNDRYLVATDVSRTITVRPKQDFTLDVKNNRPLGLWSNDTTMWVSDTGSNKIYAYNLATKARDAEKDFETLAAKNTSPRGLWSDDTTMWVANLADAKLYAYNLATKARDADKDFTLQVARNTSPRDLWSDGTTMWVGDARDTKLYAYDLATRARDTTQDFNTLAAENTFLTGIWSDGTTMWVGDFNDAKIYAYNLATKARDADKDFETLNATGNTFPESIWSDGRTMWVGDNNKLYAYALPKKDQTITFTLSPGMLGDTLDLSATASSMLEISYVSSDPSIAEVGTGMNANKLILKTLGNATITASQAGDAQYLEAPDVTQSITVSKKSQMIENFTSSLSGTVGDTLDLSATASSMLEVTYSSSNTTIAEVGTGTNAGKLILKTLGNATITASQAGDAQYLAATDVTQSITVNEKALSVDVENTDIRVWPNPVATQLNISSGSRGKLSITLRNLAGQKLQERELEGKGQMDVSHLPAGVYLLHIRTAEEATSYLIYKE